MNENEAQALDTLETVTRLMAVGVTRCSRDFRYLWANQAYASWIQRPLNEIIEHSILDVLGKRAFEELLPHFNRVLSGEKIEHEEEVYFRGIGPRWISATYYPTLDGNGAADGWVAVVIDITERKHAEKCRSRHSAIVELSEDAIISKSMDGIIESWNAGAERIFGYTEAEAVGQPISILIPPERRAEENKILETLMAGRRVEQYETVRVTKAGKRIVVSLTISPVKDSSGRVVGSSKIARDITERKAAEKALSDMTRRLVVAQEQERARIGRDLHDDVSQRLSLLAFELAQLRENNGLPSKVRGRMNELKQMASDISTSVHALSHELHPSTLDHLGLVAGVKGLCREFGERQKLEIEFQSHNVPKLPQEISLCLYRVLQEALHNAAKHSGSRRIEVQLAENSGEIHLIVNDSGKGFDIEETRQSRGLGLTSMQERVRLVGGTIVIDSKLLGGTTIDVRVPFGAERGSQNVAR